MIKFFPIFEAVVKLSLGLVINWKLYRKDNRIIYHLEYLEIEEYNDGSGTRNFGFLGTYMESCKKGVSGKFAIFDDSIKFASNLLKIQNPKLWISTRSLTTEK